MTFCRNCGAPLEGVSAACLRCGKHATAPQPYPYPHPAWQQTGYPPRAAYPAQKLPVTNLLAILGFVTALLPIPFAWLILSIAGLSQCNRTGQKGRGLAIAGIFLRLLVLAVLIAAVVLLIYYSDSGIYLPNWDWDEGFSFTFMLLGMR